VEQNPMSAAAMIQRKGVSVAVQRHVQGVDAGGMPTRSWQTIATVTMFRQPMRGSESQRLGGTRTERRATFYSVYSSDITAKDRLLFEGETWDIESVTQPGTFRAGEATSHLIIEANRTQREAAG